MMRYYFCILYILFVSNELAASSDAQSKVSAEKNTRAQVFIDNTATGPTVSVSWDKVHYQNGPAKEFWLYDGKLIHGYQLDTSLALSFKTAKEKALSQAVQYGKGKTTWNFNLDDPLKTLVLTSKR